jgi:hypothetical protein
LALNKALQHFSAACQELYGKREQYLATDWVELLFLLENMSQELLLIPALCLLTCH